MKFSVEVVTQDHRTQQASAFSWVVEGCESESEVETLVDDLIEAANTKHDGRKSHEATVVEYDEPEVIRLDMLEEEIEDCIG